MTRLIYILFACIIIGLFHQNAYAQQNNPSEVPREAMKKLSSLQGKWTSVMSMSQDRGKTWATYEPNEVEVNTRLNGMIMELSNISSSKNGWNMMHTLAYDQYRKVYRQTVNDDTWGMMDVYEGNINSEGRLVMDNLKSQTFFPGPDGVWLSFRLAAEIDECKRQTDIDVSLDEGKEWIPYIKYQYTRIDNDNCKGAE